MVQKTYSTNRMLVLANTEKAVLFKHLKQNESVWIPKSQIDEGIDADWDFMQHDVVDVDVTDWWIEKEGL